MADRNEPERKGFFERAMERLRNRGRMSELERWELEQELRDVPLGVRRRYSLAGEIAGGAVTHPSFGFGLREGRSEYVPSVMTEASLIRGIVGGGMDDSELPPVRAPRRGDYERDDGGAYGRGRR